MPPTTDVEKQAIRLRLAADAAEYPIEAFEFVERGLAYTVAKIHGTAAHGAAAQGTANHGLPTLGMISHGIDRQVPKDPAAKDRHVTGQQLCHGLREYALHQWGLLAAVVLRSWNITNTFDFGQIVYILADHKVMRTNATDSIEDFRNVYDFKTAFETGYRITSRI